MLSVKMEAIIKKSQSLRIIELSETLMQWKQELCVTSNLRKYGTNGFLKHPVASKGLLETLAIA